MRYSRWCGALLVWLLTACALPNASVAPAPTAPPLQLAPTAAQPAPQPAPTAPSVAVPTSAPATLRDDVQRMVAARGLLRDQVALAEAFKGVQASADTPHAAPLNATLGATETFWVLNNLTASYERVTAKLRYAGPVALLYIDTRLDVQQPAVEQSAREFEQRIYPRDRLLFGAERPLGADARLTILATPLRGAGGYFSLADELPQAVNRFSNQRKMFVIGSQPGTPGFGSVLAHEFQHMIEADVQRGSPAWFNEGMSTLAEDLNGYANDGTALQALAQPDTQLTTWSGDAAQTGAHYGTSRLFLRYFYEQYAQERGPAELIAADAGNRTAVFAQVAARRRPDVASFADLVADWLVANTLNDPQLEGGRYSYRLLPQTVAPQPAARGTASASVSQFGGDYLALPAGAALTFAGSPTVSLTGVPPQSGRYAWWSNRADNSVQTLTRAFDLRGVTQATLRFALWHELELDWDYGFVGVSTDEGATWRTLKGNTTTTTDPRDDNYGEALTGVSGTPGAKPDKGVRGQWVEEQMDLSAYTGKPILLRFMTINDDAYNAAGMMIDNIRVPELNYADSAEQDDGGWQAQGFVRVLGTLPQTWALRLIRRAGGGTHVERVPVDDDGQAAVQVAPDETATLLIMGSTPATTEPATYQYTLR